MLRKKFDDTRRVLIPILLSVILLWASTIHLPDPALAPVFSSTSIVLFFCTMTHVIRRILFPGFDLRLFMAKAIETPVSAAIVSLAVIYLLGQILLAFTSMVR